MVAVEALSWRAMKRHVAGARARSAVAACAMVRSAIVAGAMVACAAFAPAFAQAPPRLLAPTSQPVGNVAGAWEIAATATSRKCRIQLNQREAQDKRMILGAPPACRMAIPRLVAAAQWGLGEDGRIYLFKTDGQELETFERQPTGAFKAEGTFKSDGDLLLEPIGGRSSEAPRAETVAATMQALTGDVPANDAQRAALTGSYGLTRGGEEVCALALERTPGPRPKRGGAVWVARLDSSCRDEGLRVFDPVGWQYDDGRIFLIAKKGHTIGFTATRDSGWAKDPAAGKPLLMKKK